jgi:DNA-binding NtrC family response regulator
MSLNKVLVIEDDPDGIRSVGDAIEDAGFGVLMATTGSEGLRLAQEHPVTAIVSDLALPDIDGIEVLTRLRQSNDQVPVIIVTAFGSIETSVKAMKAGAYDYITKPLDLDELQAKVKRAAETSRLRDEVKALRQTVHQRYSAIHIVAESAPMRELLRQVQALAETNATVLVQGESGTGKELVARALHVDGKRARGPFVAVNCGAFAETLLESELFGHEKGSFTGATVQHKGAFERANGGTLFLDEIGDAPAPVQVKLLRVLEEREVMRIGGQHPFKLDVRLISASNQNLDDLVAEGRFREDLLYRLKVVTLFIPPLRERREDIRPLTDRFVAQAASDHGRRIERVEPGFHAALESCDWPGNVRQLRNVVESAVVMARAPVLKGEDVRLSSASSPSRDTVSFPSDMTLNDIERAILSQSLQRYEGNRTITAEKLGISRRTIQRKIKEHNLPF